MTEKTAERATDEDIAARIGGIARQVGVRVLPFLAHHKKTGKAYQVERIALREGSLEPEVIYSRGDAVFVQCLSMFTNKFTWRGKK